MLALFTNIKSHTGFQMVPELATSSGVMAVTLHYYAECVSFWCQIWQIGWS